MQQRQIEELKCFDGSWKKENNITQQWLNLWMLLLVDIAAFVALIALRNAWMDESEFSWRQLTKSLLVEVTRCSGPEKKLDESLLPALCCHFGRTVLLDAFELIDANAVRKHVSPSVMKKRQLAVSN
ncbi:hypothetical protein D918_00192 [Trichuris suis]|nr:hypothetical protein D918_00192 [Trichuris suis]